MRIVSDSRATNAKQHFNKTTKATMQLWFSSTSKFLFLVGPGLISFFVFFWFPDSKFSLSGILPFGTHKLSRESQESPEGTPSNWRRNLKREQGRERRPMTPARQTKSFTAREVGINTNNKHQLRCHLHSMPAYQTLLPVFRVERRDKGDNIGQEL